MPIGPSSDSVPARSAFDAVLAQGVMKAYSAIVVGSRVAPDICSDRKWSSRAKLCARVHGSQAAWAVLAWDFVTWPPLLKGGAVKRVHLSWYDSPGLGHRKKLPNKASV